MGSILSGGGRSSSASLARRRAWRDSQLHVGLYAIAATTTEFVPSQVRYFTDAGGPRQGDHGAMAKGSKNCVKIPVGALLIMAWLTSCASPPDRDATTATRSARSQEEHVLERGQSLYIVSCSGCHGANAHGTGPVSPLIDAPVPDLTLLASRRGGTFPIDEIYRIIDGQADLTAHGPRHMPVWGYEFFGEDADDEAAHREATEKIEHLVQFLQSIQRVR